MAIAPRRPAMFLFPDHPAEIIGERTWNEEHGQHLDKVGQRCRVLVGMGGIGIDKTATIRSKHLDRNLEAMDLVEWFESQPVVLPSPDFLGRP